MKKLENLRLIFSKLNGKTHPELKQYLNTFFRNFEMQKHDTLVSDLEEIEEKKPEDVLYLRIGAKQLKKMEIPLKRFKNLKVLDISENPVKDFEEIAQLKSLEMLFMDQCSLRSIPSNINKLKNLQILDLRGNYIIKLAEELFELKKLALLDLRANKINSVPPELGKLTNLAYLNLSENNIPEIPEETGKLTQLKTLDLHNNELTEIGCEIGNLIHISYLNLGENHLTGLPQEVGNLNKLEHLYLNDNKINSLPYEITKLNKLEALYFKNNPFEEMPGLNDVSSVELFSYLNKVSENGIYEVIWDVPKAFRTSFLQYLIFFPDFIERYTGKEIFFQVTREKNGLKINTRRDRNMGIKEINRYLKLYIDILNLNVNDLYELVDNPSNETQTGFELRQLVRDVMREKNHFLDKVQDHLERITFLNDSQEKQKEENEGLDFHIKYFQSYSSDLLKLVKQSKAEELPNKMNVEITNGSVNNN